ncbi:MAG TPA: homoserine kinase [Verrucomicrobium sp.]|nr:homoserine kinase [Verrucomicrobium sp.]
MSSSVTISVPATSANVGPGYDCLGIALSLYNQVTVTRLDGPPRIEPHHAMVETIGALFFQQHEVTAAPFAFSWAIGGDVPQSRGLGSSVTVRLGVLMGLNELCGRPLSKQRLFELCSDAEGHPDNVAPAVYGGFALASSRQWFRFEVQPRLKAVLLIPDFEVETVHARGVLPESVPHSDAAKNTANACTLVAAFATGEYERIGASLEDFLHQPYRRHLVPGLFEIIGAGVRAGAIGGYLSGSGSTIACLATEGDVEAIALAMKNTLVQSGATGRTVIVSPDNVGAKAVAPAHHGS